MIKIVFLSNSKMRDDMKFYKLSYAIFYDSINTIYKFIKPFLDKKNVNLRNMKPLNGTTAMPFGAVILSLLATKLKFCALQPW